ncbi:EAL domain-containing protein [Burkholderia multivorans]|uniref:EAL domain-containing protein n=1 Tax=Burkholderia multivorans TaxID=87883 RepID=UPI001C22BC62|nr:EAL domain-containing protein [Burkholderia multivorans]MBU9211644.1 EAL domain-containing protein [Burkholderia multivorans]
MGRKFAEAVVIPRMASMCRYRAQPILDAATLEVTALEVLSAGPLVFEDEAEMIQVDVAGLEYAVGLVERTGLRIHCNLEYSTLMLVPRLIRERIRPGIVIELVERHEIFEKSEVHTWIAEAAIKIRSRGGSIAMDDVTPTTLERELIKALRPEIIKVENRDALSEIRNAAKNTPIIAERIETGRHAELARKLGAREIQGFWCDRQAAGNAGHQMAENPLPTSFAAGPA